MKRLSVVLLLSVAGCSKASVADHAADAALGPSIAPECRGFALEGLRYSPGGEALPNKCQPFDAFTNNPYAVRCVDVMPGYATRYPGDEYCILPPPPDKGVQFGPHPQQARYWEQMWAGDLSGYANDALTRPFELAPGGEVEQTYRSSLSNTESRAYYRIDSRMRVGSHHMATYLTSQPGDEGWRPVDGLFVPDGADGGTFWNSQRSSTDRPASSLHVPDEDVGLGMTVAAEQGILMDLHHFNTHDVPILREAWINVWWLDGVPERPVEDQSLVAPVSVPPNSVTVLAGSFAPTSETRVLSLFGHRHAWTTRLDAWVHRADGTDEPVYDSFNWLDVPTYSYDSLSTNPVADPATEKDGASSGVLTVEPGDTLEFNCHVDTTPARAAVVGAPAPTDTLVFGNKAFGAEMCIVYAETVAAPLRDR